ncbi:DUF6578 domain-containing protein [Streptomyces sclerotialus]|uniref:DUF6578 domain-containing protein n=1 Tax=Streptomyces sclerotialus TaxID=1957 RepID=UPI0034A2858F
MSEPAENVSPPNTADDASGADVPSGDGPSGDGPSGEVLRIFYEDWEMECCGTPFSVGDRVTWTLKRATGRAKDRMWDWELNNHGPGPEDPSAITGLVRSIQMVLQGYRRPPGTHTYEAVPGERHLRPVRTCPKWFADGRADGAAGHRPDHYVGESGVLVELEVGPPAGAAAGAAGARADAPGGG